MIGKEVIIWLDQRWYDALNKHLKGGTLEEHLEEVIDQLCNQLPQREYERISQEIWQEDQANKQAQEQPQIRFRKCCKFLFRTQLSSKSFPCAT